MSLNAEHSRACVLTTELQVDCLVDLIKQPTTPLPVVISTPRIACIADMPSECIADVLDHASRRVRSMVAVSCSPLRKAVSVARKAARWAEGLWCVTSSHVPGSELSTEMFDQVKGKWGLLGTVPKLKTGAAGVVVQVATGGTSLLVAGGGVLRGGSKVAPCSTIVQKFNVSEAKWTQGAPMSVPRAGHALVQCGEYIYAIGGVGKKNSLHRSVEVCAIRGGGLWQPSAPMAEPRCMFATAVHEGRIYCIGGEGKSGPLDSVEVFDPLLGCWESLTNLIHPHSGGCATVLNDADGARIAVVGGAERFVECYDLRLKVWKEMQALPVSRTQCAAIEMDGALHVIGGITTKTGRSGESQLMALGATKLESNTWVPLQNWGKFGALFPTTLCQFP